MTAGESGRDTPSMFPFAVKMPLAILISFLLLVGIWFTAPSALPPPRLTPSQLEAFLSTPVQLEAHKADNAPPQKSVSINGTSGPRQESNETALLEAEDPTLIGEVDGGRENSEILGQDQSPADSDSFNNTDTGPAQGLNKSALLQAEAPFLNEEFDNTTEDSDFSGLDQEPITPIAARRPGSSNYSYGPSPYSDPPQPPTTDVEESPFTDLSAVPAGQADAFYEASIQSPTPTPTPSPTPAPSPSSSSELEGKRYIVPLLSSFVGTGNQLMEYKSAAVVARTLNRTLCLIPFFGGPQRHFGYLGSNHYGLHLEDRYDLQELLKFVKIESIDVCIKECNGTLDRVWKLRTSRSSAWQYWFPRIPEAMAFFDRSFTKWTSPGEIARSIGPRNDEPEAKCVGLGGAFPGLRWRGAMWAAAAYMRHSKTIVGVSDVFQAKVLGNNSYISVHWRFEESNCNGHPLGLCFTRCNDGAVIGGGLKSPRFMELPTVMENLRAGSAFHGAGLTKEDVSAAIFDKAVEQNVQHVYLSTDGWLRGTVSIENVRWVVEDLRARGMTVAGLWEIQGLPNFEDGSFVFPNVMPALFGLDKGQTKVSNHMIALVEQEICGRSLVFLGSGQSSWSLAVFEARRSARRRSDLEEQLRANYSGSGRGPLSEEEHTAAVVASLYSDKHTAGPACRGSPFAPPETVEDEAPDGWLDFEACEKRIDLGGRCVRLVGGITI
ncbi:hypothetical protein MPTK1_2g19180 [Marchantia polymorpha subsp. ruderalis]|uniref:Uncharacterized protein n=2 Tax=Marchantia polymorpha TaxID=3197 RepID=A0A176VY27_MARPO|nr:hypothetical protein AXG93_4094s1060 [Marchantia polymorpha subsp. ruderalis]PTQ30209.1 hypothetical protein MARPO_0128s0031 [Marchantia polymorpha]BBN02907.1 hypothetical protein Mp_2g19180 [Marchantia polymorpha subsp. ruderalis]|eukprot:PTQ30209.1 hypothetical protein MARPO_0128s0031 [Marchantia polymorpha]